VRLVFSLADLLADLLAFLLAFLLAVSLADSLAELAPPLEGGRTMRFGRFIAAAYHGESAVLPRVLPLFRRV